MNVRDADLSYYGIVIQGFSIDSETGADRGEVKFASTLPEVKYNDLIKDISLMNKIRLAGPASSCHDLYEQLLVTLALES